MTAAKHWFWAYYAAAWTPYAAALVVVFVSNGAPVRGSVLLALEYAVPAAVLGTGVLAVCARLPWRARGRGRTMAIHIAGAAIFAVAATAAAIALMSVERQRLVRPSFAVLRFHFNTNVLAYAALAGAGYAIDNGRRMRDEARRRSEAEFLRTRAELLALRAQLNPHFLFNAIHSLIALTRQDPRAAEAGLEQLGRLLRYSLQGRGDGGDGEAQVAVGDEWAFVSDYIALERLRLGDRLRLDACIDPGALAARSLPFLVQPLVENAVRHAVAPRAAGARLRIAIRRAADRLVFEVADDGPGADPPAVERSTGLGLRSVRQRVAAAYGELGDVAVTTAPGQGFLVRVTVPARAIDGAPS